MKRPLSATVFTLLFVTLFCAGCQLTGGVPTPDFSALKPAGPPAQGAAAWNYCVQHLEDGTSRRGFGGRVYFYDQSAEKPVKVDGNVIVYAYDESVSTPENPEPTRRYLFNEKEVKAAYAKSKIGHSYNFFIPWDNETQNGEAKTISIIAKFVPEKGASIMTQQTAVHMPGTENAMMAKADRENRTENGKIMQVAFHNETQRDEKQAEKYHSQSRIIEGNENRPTSLQTVTVSVPHHYSPAMQAALSSPLLLPQQSRTPMPLSNEIRQASFLPDTPPKNDKNTP